MEIDYRQIQIAAAERYLHDKKYGVCNIGYKYKETLNYLVKLLRR